MAKITIIAMEKASEYDALCEEFKKKLKAFGVDLNFKAIKPLKGNFSNSELRTKQTQKLLENINNTDINVFLDETGKTYNSISFSALIKKSLDITSNINFVIGGAYGMDKSLYPKQSAILRLSDMTLNHKIAKLMLTEQMYRGFCILNSHPYHHV